MNEQARRCTLTKACEHFLKCYPNKREDDNCIYWHRDQCMHLAVVTQNAAQARSNDKGDKQ